MHPETNACRTAESSINSGLICACIHSNSEFPRTKTSWLTLVNPNLPKGEKFPSVHSKVCILIRWLELGFNISSLVVYCKNWGLYLLNPSFQMAKIERTTNGAATKKTFQDKNTSRNHMSYFSIYQGSTDQNRWRLHRCWWRMLETKCVGDNMELLATLKLSSKSTGGP